jgi:hypothetical protein
MVTANIPWHKLNKTPIIYKRIQINAVNTKSNKNLLYTEYNWMNVTLQPLKAFKRLSLS